MNEFHFILVKGANFIFSRNIEALEMDFDDSAAAMHNPPSSSISASASSGLRGVQLILEEDAEVLVEEDVGVEDDRAPCHFPRPSHLAQHILAIAGEQL